MSGDFTPEQKRYLEGFVAGVQARGGNGLGSISRFLGCCGVAANGS
jgi:hypothetical protein